MMLVKECHCQRHIVTKGNQECSLCLSDKAKYSRVQEREREKQAKTLQKQKERAKGSNVAIKQVSKKQSQEQAELTRIKKELIQECPTCFSCEENIGSTLSHIISRKHKAYSTHKRNLVLECPECHHIFEHYKQTYSIMYPDKWRLKLMRVWELDTSEHKTMFHQLAAKAE